MLLILGIVIIIVVGALVLILIGMRESANDDPLQTRLEEYAARGETATLEEI
jgi:heme/copper-type cytochrome/quinol oxidase subunit 2